MTISESANLGEPVRSSDEVLAELKSLRQREGISPRRIKVEATALRSLDVVTDQMEYRGFNPADRHLGAFTVVGCVIDHEIRDLLHRQILRISLNYRSERRADTAIREAESVIAAQQMGSLESRDLFAQAVLFLSRNPYEKHREQAYQELADGLVMSVVSPCRGAQGRVVGSIAADLMLETILGLFSMEAKDELRDKLAQEVLDRVPLNREQPATFASPSMELEAHLSMDIIHRYEDERVRRLRGPVDEALPPYLNGEGLSGILLGRDRVFIERLLRSSGALAPKSSDPDFFRLWCEAFLLPMYVSSIRLLVQIMDSGDSRSAARDEVPPKVTLVISDETDFDWPEESDDDPDSFE